MVTNVAEGTSAEEDAGRRGARCTGADGGGECMGVIAGLLRVRRVPIFLLFSGFGPASGPPTVVYHTAFSSPE